MQAGFSARSRALRIAGPVTKYTSSSHQDAPMPAACGLPAAFTVPRKHVASGRARPPESCASARLHGSSAMS